MWSHGCEICKLETHASWQLSGPSLGARKKNETYMPHFQITGFAANGSIMLPLYRF
jgi:hypothetical protein